MARLPKKYISAAWRMKGTTRKNALKRAWKLYKGSRRRFATGKKSTTKRSRPRQSRPKGGRKMARRQINVSLTNLAGLFMADRLLGASGAVQQVMDGSMSAGDAFNELGQNLTNSARLKQNVPLLAGILAVRMLFRQRKVGGVGPLNIKV